MDSDSMRRIIIIDDVAAAESVGDDAFDLFSRGASVPGVFHVGISAVFPRHGFCEDAEGQRLGSRGYRVRGSLTYSDDRGGGGVSESGAEAEAGEETFRDDVVFLVSFAEKNR